MEETIKGFEVITYKGMWSDMTCIDFKYEIGKSYKTDKVELCNCGFHACLNPLDVLEYYPRYASSRYFKVKLSGDITKCGFEDTKVAATEITILEEITDNFNEVIKTEWWKNENVLDFLYFSDGLARIQREDRLYNFIDKNGKFLSTEWFNYLDDFRDGFARVKRTDGLWNLITAKGKLLSDKWFYWVDNFKEGFARVARTNGEYNFINKQGKYLSKEWFYWVDNFKEGFARVARGDDKWSKIDKTGKLIKILQ